jgi:hypothetical protein
LRDSTMNIIKGSHAVVLGLCIAVFAAEGALAKGGTAKLSSEWGSRDVQTDAKALDSMPVAPFRDDSPFMIGLSNDRDFLFILLRTSDAAMRSQILREGLVVWFDSKGGTKKQLGIQYPTGQQGGGRFGGFGRSWGRPASTDSEAMWEEAEASGALSSMDVLGPAKDDRLRMVVEKTEVPKVRISSAEGTVTYQIKIPLAATGEYHFAIGSAPGSIIGIGLTTPESTEQSGRSATGGGRGGGGGGGRGGMGGRGGGGGGRRGGGGGGGGNGGQSRGTFDQPKALKEWSTVRLAEEK